MNPINPFVFVKGFWKCWLKVESLIVANPIRKVEKQFENYLIKQFEQNQTAQFVVPWDVAFILSLLVGFVMKRR